MPSTVVLEVLEGINKGARYSFEQHATFLAGRAKKAHLHLRDDPHFSRHHFLLEIVPPCCHLRDLGSRNGTKVNDIRVDEIDLHHGDVITGGRTRLRVDGAAGCPRNGRVTSIPTLPFMPGYELGTLRLQGPHRAVYRARQHASGRAVALKVLVPQGPPTEEAAEAFLRAVTRTTSLVHRRVVRTLDAGRMEGLFFVAAEFVDSLDPLTILAGLEPKQAVRTACGFVCQLLEGLHAIHDQGLVHRNVRPANLLVHQAGSKLRAQVSDVGVAAAFEDSGLAGMTRQGDVREMLAFKAPEQVLDCRHGSPAADVYGAGATLYYLLTGAVPHHVPAGKDPHAVILEKDALPIAERRSGLPPGLAELVHKALARRAPRRFDSAAEMFHALLPFGRGRAGQ